MTFLIKLKIILSLCFTVTVFSQSISLSNKKTLQTKRMFEKLNQDFTYPDLNYENNLFFLSFNTQLLSNSGHSNIDNNGIIFSNSKFSNFHSFRLFYKNSFMLIELEPYIFKKHSIFPKNDVFHSFQYVNNHTYSESSIGFNQSQLTINIFGLGLSYGKKNHWWGPSIHNAIVLSSNSSSQETFSIGNYNPLIFNKFILDGEIIVMPYESLNKDILYFSGIRASVIYDSNPKIELGFHRSFLSANVKLPNTNFNKTWNMTDAAKLVFEPLFGESKRQLDYTIIGTPGFDQWDELISGYILLSFPEDAIKIYVELASDDNRGNFTDLRAHWDHTLAYTIGINKLWKDIADYKTLFGLEYFTNRTSNTFNPKFFRGEPNVISYYSKNMYDFFTYDGRRMGAHAGSSSSDLFLYCGFKKNSSSLFLILSKEIHGIKSMTNPEIKREISILYQKEISKKSSIMINFENEHISNFQFYSSRYSKSNLFWIGYSYTIGNMLR